MSGEPTSARESQSVLPPGLLLSVVVIEPPGAELVALTVRLELVTVKVWALEVPPPGPARAGFQSPARGTYSSPDNFTSAQNLPRLT